MEPARRAFYAAQIRQVHISRPGALCRALIDAAAVANGVNVDGAKCGCSCGGVTRYLSSHCCCPRLKLLDVAGIYKSVSLPSLDVGKQQLRRYQGELGPVVSGQTEELICFLSNEIVDRLVALSGIPMCPLGHEVIHSEHMAS